MNHTVEELLDIIYRYYPREVGIGDDTDRHALDATDATDATEEHARLVAARLRAAVDECWHALRRRISERFPEAPLTNQALHLPTGGMDACYSFTVCPPNVIGRPELWFRVSFLAPYYIVYSSRLIERDTVASVTGFECIVHGMQFHVPRSEADPGILFWGLDDESTKSITVKRRQVDITFDLSSDERRYADWIAAEIEATFGCERMPPEVGTVLVPDVGADLGIPGEVRIYDCLFSNGHEWVKPPASEQTTFLTIDASRLKPRCLAVVTVLAALWRLALAILPEMQGPRYWVVSTDGVLHKEEVLKHLAKLRPFVEAPVTPWGIAAKREIEAATRELLALIEAWDGQGAPPDAMVAWASSLLATGSTGHAKPGLEVHGTGPSAPKGSSALTRTLEWTREGVEGARAITVTVSAPERDPVTGGYFRVLVGISGFDQACSHYFHGLDAIQATLTGLWSVPDLVRSLAGRGGRVTWLGSEELGFRC